jgi:hypothetical protein
MDPTRDNPIIRFATFWWALGTFLMFALLLAVIWMFNRTAPETLEDVVAKVRYETKTKIVQAQAASLTQQAIDAAIPAVAQQLALAKPAAVEKPEQVVPGSPTASKLALTPAVNTPAIESVPAAQVPLDPALMDEGKPPTPGNELPKP